MMSPSPDLSPNSPELHWAYQYLGRPWVNGATGPDSFDCWGMLRYVQKHHFSLDVPIWSVDADDVLKVVRAIQTNPELNNWTKVSEPLEGDSVLLAHAHHPHHVGVWLNVDGGGVLHCIKGRGVIFNSLHSLKISGWGRVEFYRYAGDR